MPRRPASPNFLKTCEHSRYCIHVHTDKKIQNKLITYRVGWAQNRHFVTLYLFSFLVTVILYSLLSLVSMDQMTIKTPQPKCRLYWCLIEFIEGGGGVEIYCGPYSVTLLTQYRSLTGVGCRTGPPAMWPGIYEFGCSFRQKRLGSDQWGAAPLQRVATISELHER